MAAELTIGKLANAAEVNVETIRYYQRRGLLAKPNKPQGGHRHYPADTVKRLRFIKRAQALEFTLSEVAGLLKLDAASACAKTQKLAAGKLALIKQKIADLVAIQKVLAKLVQQCNADRNGTACPIIDVLAQD
jgi:MerR family mercuric resistance operon transcriptional regulator